MSIFDRLDGDSETPKRRFTDRRTVTTVIGADVRFVGDVTGKTNIEIRGTLEGSCRIEGLAQISLRHSRLVTSAARRSSKSTSSK